MGRSMPYTLTERLYASMRARYGDEYRCSKCDSIFQLNDRVVPKGKWYHEECFESLLL